MSEELNKETVEEVSNPVETTESNEQPAQEEKKISSKAPVTSVKIANISKKKS